MAFLPRTADRVWLHSFAAIVPPLIEAFRPQVIVAQHGADPHRSDPLADLSLSVDAMALAQRLVIDLADRFADGRWIGVGGGGYNRDAVGRTWSSLLASAQDETLDPTTPRHPAVGVGRPRRRQGLAHIGRPVGGRRTLLDRRRAHSLAQHVHRGNLSGDVRALGLEPYA